MSHCTHCKMKWFFVIVLFCFCLHNQHGLHKFQRIKSPVCLENMAFTWFLNKHFLKGVFLLTTLRLHLHDQSLPSRSLQSSAENIIFTYGKVKTIKSICRHLVTVSYCMTHLCRPVFSL